MSKKEWDWMDDLEEESNYNIRFKKIKRIKNEFKRNKTKDNRSRIQGGGTTDKGFEGSDY
tara:strand:+ start:1458 stop:1637 length:180 start_codon:yes stop_codon:yes gene_type:complete